MKPRGQHYSIAGGRVATRSLEAHVVDHCNLRCAGCCSLSPLLPPWFEAPAALARDLEWARAVLAPATMKLLGGEPLLHPRLLDCIDAVRASGIAPRLSITTNGHLLPDMPLRFWESIDAITISVYPKPPLSERKRALIDERAARHAVEVNWKPQNEFEAMHRDTPAAAAATAAVYATCWLRERCNVVRDGRLFQCPRPIHLDTLERRGGALAAIDSVSLAPRVGLVDDVLAYLSRPLPLATCTTCRGGDAPRYPHRQLHRGERAFV